MGKELEDVCDRYLSRKEEKQKVIEAVERCLKKNYDYEKLKDKVLDVVSDTHKAHKIIEKITSIYSQFRKRTRFEENKGEKNGGSEPKRFRDEPEVKREPRDRDSRDSRDVKRELRDRNEGDKRDSGKRESDRKEPDRDKRESDRKEPDRDKDRDRDRKPPSLSPPPRVIDDRDQRTSNRDRERIRRMALDMLERQKKHEEEEKMAGLTEEQLRVKEMMYKAQQDIEEKKKAMAALLSGTIPHDDQPAPRTNMLNSKAFLRPQEAAMFATYSIEKKNRMEELKAKLGSSKVLGTLPTTPVVKKEPEPVVAVEKKPKKEAKEAEQEIKEYLDPRIHNKAASRKARTFNFHEKGEFEKLANKQRAMAKLERLQADISEKASTTGISSAVKLAMVTPAGHTSDIIPDIEWWDQIVLEKNNYDEIPDETVPARYADTISELVEHPIQLRPPTEALSQQYIRVYLTTKEKKKIRRQNRKEMQKEKTEKIRLGLEKPPEPKVKLSNLMRVLGSDAVQDPTKMEAHVRKQMADRMKKHEAENAARKLTDAQKAAKKTKKLSEDTSLAVHVAVYRVKSLANPSKRFKVETNAKQLQMTGMVLLYKDLNVIVVEGGPKQQKFYKNLMMTRIKWTEEIIGEEKKVADKEAPGERNELKLIWEGTVKKRAFYDMRTLSVSIQKQARETFEKYRVPHYWDLCLSSQVLLDNNEDSNQT
ncbi:unnamed protein product, partial [Mesorhabditis belari]|uniref:U4/U6 small nuclear ribonucleoprotein Prp3 n=1 Tax=Mesorhabditis belari TaxID=2138241 RepID=A0AAF3ENI8_9BILA